MFLAVGKGTAQHLCVCCIVGLFLTFWMALSLAGFACAPCHVDLDLGLGTKGI